MINVNGVHPPVAPNPIEPAGQVAPAGGAARPAEVADVVEISQAAMLAAKVHEIPDVRAELVEQVKAEIASGTYDTPERLEIAISRLIEEVFPDLL